MHRRPFFCLFYTLSFVRVIKISFVLFIADIFVVTVTCVQLVLTSTIGIRPNPGAITRQTFKNISNNW